MNYQTEAAIQPMFDDDDDVVVVQVVVLVIGACAFCVDTMLES